MKYIAIGVDTKSEAVRKKKKALNEGDNDVVLDLMYEIHRRKDL